MSTRNNDDNMNNEVFETVTNLDITFIHNEKIVATCKCKLVFEYEEVDTSFSHEFGVKKQTEWEMLNHEDMLSYALIYVDYTKYMKWMGFYERVEIANKTRLYLNDICFSGDRFEDMDITEEVEV